MISDISEPDRGADNDLAALQRVLAMLAKDLDEFCVANGITYYLMGGTALGAIRHSGFIPWDDDYDIFMDRENYLRFLSVCETKLDQNKYYLQHEDSDEWPLLFSKIRLNDTHYVEREEDEGKMHTGIYIDVMCLHNAYTSKSLRFLQFLAARGLSAMALSRRGYQTDKGGKRMALFVGRHLSRTFIKSLLLWFVRSLDGKGTTLVGHFFGRAPFAKTSFPTNFLGVPRRVKFESEMLPVPSDVEGYLATRFGPKYMEIPDQETRDSFPKHMIAVDLGPYRDI